MIFANIRTQEIAQVDEMVRLFGTESYISDFLQIQKIEIRADAADSWVEIQHQNNVKNIFLDWVYSTVGNKTPEIKITKTDLTEITKTTQISILTKTQDNLFSSDDDLVSCEPDLFRYLPEGRNNFNYLHREAQRRILAWLDEQRIWKSDLSRYERQDIKDLQEFREWSKYLALAIFFESQVISPNDSFDLKSRKYFDLVFHARKRAALRLEFDTNNKPTKILDRVSTILIKR